jgi:hypothetical protein
MYKFGQSYIDPPWIIYNYFFTGEHRPMLNHVLQPRKIAFILHLHFSSAPSRHSEFLLPFTCRGGKGNEPGVQSAWRRT